MPEKDDQKREAPISYRPPSDLRDEFHKRVLKSGLTTNAFINKAVFNIDPPRHSRRPPIERALIARLLGEAVHIRDALHEIALAGGDEPANTLPIEAAMDDLTEIRSALIKMLGRQP